MNKRIVILLSVLVAFCAGSRTNTDSLETPATQVVKIDEATLGFNADNKEFKKIIYVDGDNDKASDDNTGTKDAPLKSLRAAGIRAVENKRQSLGTKIIIRPGVYREQLLIPTNIGDLKNETPILFEASEKGKAIVSGSDVWGDWKLQPMNDTRVYVHEWPYKWGAASVPPSIPANYQSSFEEKPLIKRREMIFVNGILMKQLSSLEEPTEGSFFVDDDKRTVFLVPPAGVDLTSAKVEVAVRPSVLFADFAKNVSFCGLIFEHANTSFNPDYYNPGKGYQDTNRINNSSQILFEDVQFIWNNMNGVAFVSSSQITLRRTIASHNGLGGMTGFKLKNILFEETETSENNWRGEMSDYRDWGVAGLKFLAVHKGIFRRHIASNNMTRGFWLDFDNSDIIIDGCNFASNKADGVFLEANSGPIKMIETRISDNEGPGLLTSAAHDLTLEKNIFINNTGPQIFASGDAGGRMVDNWETKESLRFINRNWTLRDNTFTNLKTEKPLFSFAPQLTSKDWKAFSSSFNSDANIWFSVNRSKSFGVRNSMMNFKEWQSLTGKEINSRFTAPAS